VTDAVTWVSLIASATLFTLGVVDLCLSWKAVKLVKSAVAKAALVAEGTNENEERLKQQAAIDFKSAWEPLAALALAIKDLDRSSRLLVLSLAFLAVAALTSSTGVIAAAVS
jgi:hypothetical protein